jgi:hypothetical protein
VATLPQPYVELTLEITVSTQQQVVTQSLTHPHNEALVVQVNSYFQYLAVKPRLLTTQ